MRILIVDDEEIARTALAKVLSDAGHEVVSASNGEEALALLHRQPCRMVISDWVMPRMDGLELCRRIRRESFPSYVYVILVTSRHDTDDVVSGLSAGADDFITKPFNPAELRVRAKAGERVLALETRDVAIFALAKLAESRDPETGAHLERVRNYARLIADYLRRQNSHPQEVDADYVRMIFLTSPLHDIGKVGIPDSVLLKPGRLNDREFEIMKSHTTIGAETLDAALRQYPEAGFLRMARDIALTHHERFDGNGYPTGLTSTEIPLCGRIVALADVYDALTSRRVYKKAFTHEVARSLIVESAGSQFDPQLIAAFEALEDEFLAISHEWSEPSPSDRGAPNMHRTLAGAAT